MADNYPIVVGNIIYKRINTTSYSWVSPRVFVRAGSYNITSPVLTLYEPNGVDAQNRQLYTPLYFQYTNNQLSVTQAAYDVTGDEYMNIKSGPLEVVISTTATDSLAAATARYIFFVYGPEYRSLDYDQNTTGWETPKLLTAYVGGIFADPRLAEEDNDHPLVPLRNRSGAATGLLYKQPSDNESSINPVVGLPTLPGFLSLPCDMFRNASGLDGAAGLLQTVQPGIKPGDLVFITKESTDSATYDTIRIVYLLTANTATAITYSEYMYTAWLRVMGATTVDFIGLRLNRDDGNYVETNIRIRKTAGTWYLESYYDGAWRTILTTPAYGFTDEVPPLLWGSTSSPSMLLSGSQSYAVYRAMDGGTNVLYPIDDTCDLSEIMEEHHLTPSDIEYLGTFSYVGDKNSNHIYAQQPVYNWQTQAWRFTDGLFLYETAGTWVVTNNLDTTITEDNLEHYRVSPIQAKRVGLPWCLPMVRYADYAKNYTMVDAVVFGSNDQEDTTNGAFSVGFQRNINITNTWDGISGGGRLGIWHQSTGGGGMCWAHQPIFRLWSLPCVATGFSYLRMWFPAHYNEFSEVKASKSITNVIPPDPGPEDDPDTEPPYAAWYEIVRRSDMLATTTESNSTISNVSQLAGTMTGFSTAVARPSVYPGDPVHQGLAIKYIATDTPAAPQYNIHAGVSESKHTSTGTAVYARAMVNSGSIFVLPGTYYHIVSEDPDMRTGRMVTTVYHEELVEVRYNGSVWSFTVNGTPEPRSNYNSELYTTYVIKNNTGSIACARYWDSDFPWHNFAVTGTGDGGEKTFTFQHSAEKTFPNADGTTYIRRYTATAVIKVREVVYDPGVIFEDDFGCRTVRCDGYGGSHTGHSTPSIEAGAGRWTYAIGVLKKTTDVTDETTIAEHDWTAQTAPIEYAVSAHAVLNTCGADMLYSNSAFVSGNIVHPEQQRVGMFYISAMSPSISTPTLLAYTVANATKVTSTPGWKASVVVSGPGIPTYTAYLYDHISLEATETAGYDLPYHVPYKYQWDIVYPTGYWGSRFEPDEPSTNYYDYTLNPPGFPKSAVLNATEYSNVAMYTTSDGITATIGTLYRDSSCVDASGRSVKVLNTASGSASTTTEFDSLDGHLLLSSGNVENRTTLESVSAFNHLSPLTAIAYPPVLADMTATKQVTDGTITTTIGDAAKTAYPEIVNSARATWKNLPVIVAPTDGTSTVEIHNTFSCNTMQFAVLGTIFVKEV